MLVSRRINEIYILRSYKMKEIIHDGNIYYDIPCKKGCGITMLTIDEVDDKCCGNCDEEL
tara:strand:- start:417 stop:596 length:180 start_codon:yes stop_codon:yes gene_type:complete